MGRFPRTTDGKWFKLTAPEIEKMCHEAKVDYPVSARFKVPLSLRIN